MKNKIHWRDPKTDPPEDQQKVLAFSPCYNQGHEMRFRIISGQFLKFADEVKLWANCEELLASSTPEIEQESKIQEWAETIALNEKSNAGETKIQLLEACEDLALEKENMDRRYQSAGKTDLSKKEGIYFILTGKPFPSKAGYIWQ